MPGLAAESGALRSLLAEALGDEAQVDALIEGGARAIERRTDLDSDTRRRAHRLLDTTLARTRLEDSGIVVTSDVLREAVRRDIEMLFNIERLQADYTLTDRELMTTTDTAQLLADFPQVRTSVVNYGVPSFSGRSSSDFDPDALARELKQVLNVYEPRLKRDSVRVTVETGDKTGVRIQIDGVLMLSPVPERLRLSTTIDLDNGQAATRIEDR